MFYSVFIRNTATDGGGKWRLLSRNKSTGLKIQIIATEIQAKHKHFDLVKDCEQEFPDEKETVSLSLISDHMTANT